MSDRQPTCEERIAGHRESRLQDWRDLFVLADAAVGGGFATDDPPRHEELGERAEIAERAGVDWIGQSPDAISEAALERLYAYPLGVSTRTVFRIDISTGGPADWLEVFAFDNTPDTGGPWAVQPPKDYEVERIVYHFSDWYDHAEETLTGEDFDTAERFARQVVAELVE